MIIDFCLPVRNEDEIFLNNAEIVWNFLQLSKTEYNWRLVFIVNGSNQKFIDLVENFVNQHRPQAVCFIIKEGGKGRAIKTYFDQSDADVLVYMDIDLAVDLNNLSQLLEPILSNKADLCFGSRMLPSSAINRSWFRSLSSKVYLQLSRYLLNHNFTDLQCGFKAVTKTAWQSISYLILDRNWFFDTEFICLAQKKFLLLKEIPVNWSENRYLKRRSKVNVYKEVWIFLLQTIKLRKRLKKI